MNDMRLMNKREYTQMVNTVSESLKCEQNQREKDFDEKLTTYDACRPNSSTLMPISKP